MNAQAQAATDNAKTIEALEDAITWISEMLCDEKTTHPRLKCLRHALAVAKGEQQ